MDSVFVRSFLTSLLLFIFVVTPAAAVSIDSMKWSKQLGGSDGDAAMTLATNSQGQVIMAGGYHSDNFDPDGESGSESYSTPGGRSGYISVFDADGTYAWTQVLTGGASSYVNIKEIAVDANDNIYIVGNFTLTVDFDPGAGTENRVAPSFSSDIFVLKLSSEGVYQWVQTLGNTGYDYGDSIALSGDTVFVGGSFRGTVDFDTSGDSDSRDSAGGSDAFIWALDYDGNHQFVKTFGSTGTDDVDKLVYSEGKVYSVGEFAQTVDFDPGAGSENVTSSGESDAYLLVLSEDGDFQEVITWGGPQYDASDYVEVSTDGSVYVTGYFDDTVDFDPGDTTNNKTTVGSDDFYVSKFDSDLIYRWTATFGSTDADYVWGLDTDSENNVYITGEFYETMDFNPGSDTHNVTATGSNAENDIFILQLTDNGEYGEVITMGSDESDYGVGLIVVGTNLYVSGNFSETVAFNGEDESAEFTTYGATDAFLTAWLLTDFAGNGPGESSSSGVTVSRGRTNSAKAPSCSDPVPQGDIDLFQISRSLTSATIFFAPINDTVDSYHVVYGYFEGDERFGGLSVSVTNASNTGVQTMEVHHLEPWVKYWFKVIPASGCAVGQWSNWLQSERPGNTFKYL